MITEFLQNDYKLPLLGFHKGRVVHFTPVKSHNEKKKPSTDADTLLLKQKMYSTTRNANKRLKRREATISNQKECIEQQRQTIKEYEKKLERTESSVHKLRMKLNRVNHRASYWKGRFGDVKEQREEKSTQLRHEIKKLKLAISDLDRSNAELHEELESIMSSDEIITFEGGKYTDDVRACVYELLSLNVGVRNVRSIIQSVLNNIAHKSVGRLPSHGLTCQMIIESLTAAQAQLGQELLKSDCPLTIQTDGTTKHGDHFATYDISTSKDEQPYTLGLRHIFSGSAMDTMDTFKEILQDIDNVQKAIGKDAVSSEMVAKIKNTMSDRHSAEKKFNHLLHDYRMDLLPDVVENWNKMTNEEKETLTRMNNFFCGLHFVVGLADSAEEVLKVWEAQHLDEHQHISASASRTQTLIRTACKAFHHQGSQKCGTSTLFRTYLRKKGVHKIPLAKFIGNRFNIIFYDAAGVYYLQKDMIQFIVDVHGKNANLLLQAVLSDLKQPFIIAGCRALGLIDKIVTGPLWRKLIESPSSILQMSSVYSRIKAKFNEWNGSSCSILLGNDILEARNPQR